MLPTLDQNLPPAQHHRTTLRGEVHGPDDRMRIWKNLHPLEGCVQTHSGTGSREKCDGQFTDRFRDAKLWKQKDNGLADSKLARVSKETHKMP